MYIDIEERTLRSAYYILENEVTIRKCAEIFNVGKSTIHYDLNNRLPKLNSYLYNRVKAILENNFKVKHIRGGESTRLKYIERHDKKQMLNK